ncbi:MAG: hypothetical protein AB8D78_02405, partial [Akkermansiaceae bacterium]
MSEKSVPLWLKALAVLSAIVLATAYIAYRDRLANTPSEDLTNQDSLATETEEPKANSEDPQPIIMSSSKSEMIPLEMTPELRRALMSSSKSGLVIPLPETEEEVEEPAQQKLPRTV